MGHTVSGPIPSTWDHLFTRFQKCWKAEELVTLTTSSSSRYRDIIIMNQWLDNQESWLEALPGGKECWQLGKDIFVLSVCKKFWLGEHDDGMDFILCVSC